MTVLRCALAAIVRPWRLLPEITFRSAGLGPPIVLMPDGVRLPTGESITMPAPLEAKPWPSMVVPMRLPAITLRELITEIPTRAQYCTIRPRRVEEWAEKPMMRPLEAPASSPLIATHPPGCVGPSISTLSDKNGSSDVG